MEEIDNVVQEVQKNKTNWERILLYGACFLALLWGAKGCFDTSKLEGKMAVQAKEIKTLKSQYKEEKKEFIAVQDSLKKDTEAKQDSINKLHKERDIFKKNISALKTKNTEQKKELNTYKNKDYVKLFNTYFKTQSAVETPNGVELQKELPKKVAETIFDTEMYKNQLKEAYNIIENQKQEITLEQGKTSNAEIERDKSLDLLFSSEEIVNNQGDYIKNADKTISRLKTQKVFQQIALPVGIGLGILTGILISK